MLPSPVRTIPTPTITATMSAFSYQPLLLVNSDASLVWDTPNSTSRPPFPLDSRHSLLCLCLLSSHFYFSRVLSPNIHPSHPPSTANQRNRLGKHERNLLPCPFFFFFRLVQTYYCTITACISSCTHCLLQVSASCGATARRGFESPSPIFAACMRHMHAGKRGEP
ncbi:hypothetical protein GGI42DRAFT_212175 [Trichoderma sp. SZMC 28013]